MCCKNLKIVFWFRELCLKSNAVLHSYKISLENGTQQLDIRFADENSDNSENKNQIKEQLCEQTKIKNKNNLKTCENLEVINSNTNNGQESFLDSMSEQQNCLLVETQFLPEDYLNVKLKTEITDENLGIQDVNSKLPQVCSNILLFY